MDWKLGVVSLINFSQEIEYKKSLSAKEQIKKCNAEPGKKI